MKFRLSDCPWALLTGLLVALLGASMAVWLGWPEEVEAGADRTWSECWRAQNGNSGFTREGSLPVLAPGFFEELGLSPAQFFDVDWQVENLRPLVSNHPIHSRPQDLVDAFYHDGIGRDVSLGIDPLSGEDFTVVNRDSRMGAAVGIEWVPPDRIPNSDLKVAEYIASRNAMVTQGVSYEDGSTEAAMADDQAKARHNREIRTEGIDRVGITTGSSSCTVISCSSSIGTTINQINVTATATDRLVGAAASCTGDGCEGGAARVFGWLVKASGSVYEWVNPFLEEGDLVDSRIAAFPEKEVGALQPDFLPDTDSEGILVSIQLAENYRQDALNMISGADRGSGFRGVDYRRFGNAHAGYMSGALPKYQVAPHELEAGEFMPKRSYLWEAHPSGVSVSAGVADLTDTDRILTMGDIRWPVYLRDMAWYLYRVPAGGDRSSPDLDGTKIVTQESALNEDLAARQVPVPKGFFESKDFIDALVGDLGGAQQRLFSNDAGESGDFRDIHDIAALPTEPLPVPDPDSELEFALVPDAGLPNDIGADTFYFPFGSGNVVSGGSSRPSRFPHDAVLVKAGVASPVDGEQMSRFQFHIADGLRFGSLPDGNLTRSLGISNRGTVPFSRFQDWPNAPLSPNHTHILVVTFYEAREAGTVYVKAGFEDTSAVSVTDDVASDFKGGLSIPRVEYRRILCRVLVPPMGVAATEKDAWYTKLGRQLGSIPEMLAKLPQLMIDYVGRKVVESAEAVGREGERGGCSLAQGVADFGGVEEGEAGREECDDFAQEDVYVQCVGPAAVDCTFLPEPKLNVTVLSMQDETLLSGAEGQIYRNYYVGTPDDYQAGLHQRVTDTGPTIAGVTFDAAYIDDTLGLSFERFPHMGCLDDESGDCGENPLDVNRARLLPELHIKWESDLGDYDGYVLCIQPGHTAWHRYYYQGLPGMDVGDLADVVREKDIDTLVPGDRTAFLWAGESGKAGWCRYFYLPRYVVDTGGNLVDMADLGLRVGIGDDPYDGRLDADAVAHARERTETLGSGRTIPIYETRSENGDLLLLQLYLENRLTFPLGETHRFSVATYQGDLLLDGLAGLNVGEFSDPLELNAETLHCPYWEGSAPAAGSTAESAYRQWCSSLDLSGYAPVIASGMGGFDVSGLVDMGPVWTLLGREVCKDILTSTNPNMTFNLPLVREGWTIMWVLAMILIPIMMVWEAGRMVYGSWFGSGGLVVLREFVPRLVFALLLATASFLICQTFIVLSNQVTCFVAESFGVTMWKVVGIAFNGVFTNFLGLFTGVGSAGLGAGALMTGPLGLAAGPAVIGAVALVLLALFAAVFFVVMKLVIVLLIRMLLLAGLILVSPVALLMVVSPSTQHLARRWFGVFLATLFQQVMIVVVLYIGFAVIDEFGLRGLYGDNVAMALLAGLSVFLVFYLASKVSDFLSSTVGGVTGGAFTELLATMRTSTMVMAVAQRLPRPGP